MLDTFQEHNFQPEPRTSTICPLPEIEHLPEIDLFGDIFGVRVEHTRSRSETQPKRHISSLTREPEPFTTGLEGWEPVPGVQPLHPRRLKSKSVSELKVSKILGKTESQRKEMEISIMPIQYRPPVPPKRLYDMI